MPRGKPNGGVSRTYCGIRPLPRGKKQGNAKSCLAAHQIRKYGLYPLPTQLFHEALKYPAKRQRTLLDEEKLEAKQINQAKILLNELKKINLILDHRDEYSPKKIKRYTKRKAELIAIKKRLVPRFRKQQALVTKLKKAHYKGGVRIGQIVKSKKYGGVQFMTTRFGSNPNTWSPYPILTPPLRVHPVYLTRYAPSLANIKLKRT
jgi:hypothetical protein